MENGVVTIQPVDGEKLVAAVKGGFLSVTANGVIVLADYAQWAEDIDESEASRELESAEDEDAKNLAEARVKAIQRKNKGI